MRPRNFPGKALIQYKRKGYRRPTAVVIAIDANVVGYSICDKEDKFVKEEGLRIALQRAQAMQLLSEEDREKHYAKWPIGLRSICQKMQERSQSYFQL